MRESQMNSQTIKSIKLVEKIKAAISARYSSYIDKYNNLSSVSASVAKKIQITHLNLLVKPKKSDFTPIYETILSQLQVDNEQIRHAAVSNLIDIANNNSENKKDIVRELKRYSKKTDGNYNSTKLALKFIENYRKNRVK